MKRFLAYLSLVPEIVRVVKAIEDVVPLPAQGRAKLDLVLALVAQLRAEISEVPVDTLAAVVTNIVATVVNALNAMGVFHKPEAK